MVQPIDEKVSLKKDGENYIVEETYINKYTKEEIKLAYKNFLKNRDNLKLQLDQGVKDIGKQLVQLKKLSDAVAPFVEELSSEFKQMHNSWALEYNRLSSMITPEVQERQKTDIAKLERRLVELRNIAGEILLEEKIEERKEPKKQG